MSPLLADLKLLAMITWWNLRTLAGTKALPNIASIDISRVAAIRALRKDLELPDKYPLVPCLEDLPKLADATPFGFEALQMQVDPSAKEVNLQGMVTS